jgi:amino acid transporter
MLLLASNRTPSADICSFCITNLEDYLNGSEFPIIDIIHDATGSRAATCVLGGLLILLLFFSTVTTVASASRQVWAFSRDRGFPFSSWICYVRPAWEIPANAVSCDTSLENFITQGLTESYS